MKFALIIHESPEDMALRNGPTAPAYWGAWVAYDEAVTKAGVKVGGAGLELPSTATTLRSNAAGKHVQDGPFADSKEQLAGFFLIDVPGLDQAIEWARRIPIRIGAVEIRPLLTMPD